MNFRLLSITIGLVIITSLVYAQSDQPPHVIFILTDDLGYGDLKHYGHRFIDTPNLDTLAKQGLTLTHFYAPSPLCSPSRAGMLTGRTPFRTGIKSWIPENNNIYLRQQELTIASLLKRRGYQTFFAGKWHLNGGLDNLQHPQPQDHGFDYWLGTHNFTLPTHRNPDNFFRNSKPLGEIEGFAAQIVMDEAIGWLDSIDRQQPFFMYVSLHEPHSEIASPDSFNIHYRQFTDGPVDLDNLMDRGPGEYYANVSHLDFQVGRLMDKLDQLKLTERTLVIFTSDNGPVTNQWRYWWEVNMYGETGGLRGRKADLFEGGLRVPCILRYPGVINAGVTSDIPIHGYDLLPTICALTDTPLPRDRILDGQDFSGIFQGQPLNRSQPLFWAFEIRDYDDPYGYHYAARKEHWKLITDKTLEKALLYNLNEDPYEVIDHSSENPKLVQELKAAIKVISKSIEEDALRPEYDKPSRD